MLELSKGRQLARRYTLDRRLGSGGEAQTWLARDRMTGAQVALKLVVNEPTATARLRAEWQTNLRLMHAHIARAFEFHEDGEVAFYSQQYIDGPDIGILSGAAAADILAPLGLLADALRYAHGKGIVHRDIKASNILLDHNGAPYLCDFGVAAEIGAAVSGGAIVAQSPQSLQSAPAQPADDIFALGGLAFELLSGRSPWSPAATTEDILRAAPPGLTAASGEELPADIVALVADMLSGEAASRPAAEDVVERLAAAGFRPAPTHAAQVRRARAIESRDEAVTAVRRAPVAGEAGTPGQRDAGADRWPRVIGWTLAALVVVLLGVVFVLPASVERAPETAAPQTTAEVPTVAGTDAQGIESNGLPGDRVSRDYEPENLGLDDEVIRFNENQADYSGLDDSEKRSFNVDMILGELLSNFETLERRSVQRWAAAEYEQSRSFYAAGDAAYLQKDFAAAEVHYLDALSMLEPLFDRIEGEFERALSGAQAAFEAGDRNEALRLFELAVAITPNDPRARAGYERAKNLEAVLRLVEQGRDFEQQLELDAAEQSYSRAAELDPAWQPALDGIERVQQTRTQIAFDTRMSEGLEALASEDYLSARAAFRVAQRLLPDSTQPADGLLQVELGLRLESMRTLQQEAEALERAEDWDAAATTYEEILKIDGNVEFALDGLARARRMSALHATLDEHMKNPDALSGPAVMQKATMLVVDITRMGEIGPRLARQRDELSRLLKRAATPLNVELVSDNMTNVTVYKVGTLGHFTNKQLQLRPGTYVAVGVRPGFRDVRLEFRVAPEIDMQPVAVRCEEAI